MDLYFSAFDNIPSPKTEPPLKNPTKKPPMDLKSLRALLEVAWCAETAKGEWNPNCPSLNQCAITALVIQDYFGGDLLRCKMTNDDSHYWNRLPDGNEVDLTADQFDALGAKPIKEEFVIRQRDYVLSFESTRKRYELLTQRLNSLIAQIS